MEQSVLWVQEDRKEFEETSGQKEIPEISVCRVFREIQDLLGQKETVVLSVLKEIRGLPVLQGQKGNVGKKGSVAPPENRVLPVSKDLRANLARKASRAIRVVQGLRESRVSPDQKGLPVPKEILVFQVPKVTLVISALRAKKGIPGKKANKVFQGLKETPEKLPGLQ
ncbi:hypothetical protein KQI91_10275 [Blautia sp. MSJ-19]|nr:hypothetical protein [Blautia sp. MSJ-19]